MEAEENDLGDQYAMTDYHVFSQESPEGPVVDHDASLSGGVSHKRCVKVQELFYENDGSIRPMEP